MNSFVISNVKVVTPYEVLESGITTIYHALSSNSGGSGLPAIEKTFRYGTISTLCMISAAKSRFRYWKPLLSVTESSSEQGIKGAGDKGKEIINSAYQN